MDEPIGTAWVDLFTGPLEVERGRRWVTLPGCGAVVVFCGTARDHFLAAGGYDLESASEGSGAGAPGSNPVVVRGVTGLEYEAYEGPARERMAAIVGEAQERWPVLGRVLAWHRLGSVPVGEEAVVVAVSSPHRREAFAAAEWCMDTVKESVPVWKAEILEGARVWSPSAIPIVEQIPRAAELP